MRLQADVLVIGAGAAGCVAAAAAARGGARVVVLHAGASATSMSSGAVDVADGGVFAEAGDLLGDGAPYADNMDLLAARLPHHPYTAMGSQGRSQIEAALDLLAELTGDLPLTASQKQGHNLVLATSIGTVKRAARAQRSIAFGDLETLRGCRIGVAHLGSYPGFDGRSVSSVLRLAATTAIADKQFMALPLELPFLQRQRDQHLSTYQMAALLDDTVAVDALAGSILRSLRAQSHLQLLLVPGIIGLRQNPHMMFRLQAMAGLRVAETCMLAPSPPGQRLDQALRSGLIRSGVEVVKGRLTSGVFPAKGPAELVYQIPGSQKQRSFAASAVVVATGHPGLQRQSAHKTLQDGALGLPLFFDGKPLTAALPLLGKRLQDQHPLMQVGLMTDQAQRPLGQNLKPVSPNLFAAGALLGGNDPSRHKAGIGLCALTGYLAGQRAVEASGR